MKNETPRTRLVANTKNSMKPKRKDSNQTAQTEPAKPRSVQRGGSTPTLSQCYLEHAARETAWAAQHSKQCEYQAAANALERRGAWLMAALIAQERKA